MKTIKLIIVSLLLWTTTTGQSIRINEFSQGISGAKEWVELVVSSTSPVDNISCILNKINIAGWVLDDNNGDFSPPDHFTGSGLAAGHMRFKNQLPWNSLPVGAIIVIYNAADRDVNIPADDPFDWLNNDCVYILPSNHPSIEYCTTSPLVSTCTSRTDYSTCIYGTAGGWATVGLANSGDAIQVRDPSFNLIHGIVYGKSASVSGCTTTPNMVGNSLAPLITTLAMSGTSASVVNSSDLDYFNPTKWVVQNANLATPGVANNVQNENYISNTVRGGCTCNRILLVQNKPTLLQNNKINVKLVGTVLNINTKNNQNIYIYNSIGQLINSITNTNNQINLHQYMSSGLNLIKVAVDDNKGSVFMLKYLK